MVTGTAKVTVIQGTFLIPVGLTHGAVHVQNDLLDGLFFMESIDPLFRQVNHSGQVFGLGENLCLETSHLAGGGGLFFPGTPSDHMT